MSAHDDHVATDEPVRYAFRGPLDEVGQQSEQMRERIGGLSLRLDDLKTLADDFGQIVQPIHDFVVQHAQTHAKLMETEALLHRERELSAASRAELGDLHGVAARQASDLSTAMAGLKGHEEALRDQDAQIIQLRLRLDDQTTLVGSLEKQLAVEVDRARTATDDNQSLRADIDRLEQIRSGAEADLAETREQLSIANNETARLQQLAESLSHRISTLKGQVLELEPQIQSGRQEISLLQTKLSTEQLSRQKAEVTREAERSSQEAEIASLTMKGEGLQAHIQTTEKILSNLRDQLRDKTDALRAAERSLKDALSEKGISERRLEASQDVAGRQLAQINESQRLATEFKERGDVLAKALSAKEALLDSSSRKIANLTGRIEQINSRFEQDRASFEATNRRLIEELQSEKAERSLAQGALDIARSSRSKLLTQYTALKRLQGAVGRGAELLDDESALRFETVDNVHVLKSGEKGE